MAVSAHAVLAELRARRPGMGQKKSQKLLYYCQGHHLAMFGRPLFRERISAWDMGPVVGEVWYAEKNGEPVDVDPLTDEGSLNTVGYVLSRYGALSGDELERLTHTEPPWRQADERRSPGGSEPIAPEWIEEYFRTAVGDEEEDIELSDDAVADLVRDARTRRRQPATEDAPDELRVASQSCGRESGSVPSEPRWRLTKFLTEFDAWCDRESVTDDVRLVVLEWIMSRMEDPYQGVRRAEGFENLWFAKVPDTYDPASGRRVTCSYWIDELDHTVRLDNFGLQ